MWLCRHVRNHTSQVQCRCTQGHTSVTLSSFSLQPCGLNPILKKSWDLYVSRGFQELGLKEKYQVSWDLFYCECQQHREKEETLTGQKGGAVGLKRQQSCRDFRMSAHWHMLSCMSVQCWAYFGYRSQFFFQKMRWTRRMGKKKQQGIWGGGAAFKNSFWFWFSKDTENNLLWEMVDIYCGRKVICSTMHKKVSVLNNVLRLWALKQLLSDWAYLVDGWEGVCTCMVFHALVNRNVYLLGNEGVFYVTWHLDQ